MRCVLVISAVIYESAAVGALKARAPAWSFIQRGSSRKCLKGRVMSTAARAFNLGRSTREATYIQYISPLICPQVHPSTRPQCATFPLAADTPCHRLETPTAPRGAMQRENSSRYRALLLAAIKSHTAKQLGLGHFLEALYDVVSCALIDLTAVCRDSHLKCARDVAKKLDNSQQ